MTGDRREQLYRQGKRKKLDRKVRKELHQEGNLGKKLRQVIEENSYIDKDGKTVDGKVRNALCKEADFKSESKEMQYKKLIIQTRK